MAQARCIWAKEIRDDLEELEILGVKSASFAEGPKIVWVCPEHRERVERHFRITSQYGPAVISAQYAGLVGSVLFGVLPWTGFIDQSMTIEVLRNGCLMAALLLTPFNPSVAGIGDSGSDMFRGLRHHLRAMKVILILSIALAIFGLALLLR